MSTFTYSTCENTCENEYLYLYSRENTCTVWINNINTCTLQHWCARALTTAYNRPQVFSPWTCLTVWSSCVCRCPHSTRRTSAPTSCLVSQQEDSTTCTVCTWPSLLTSYRSCYWQRSVRNRVSGWGEV